MNICDDVQRAIVDGETLRDDFQHHLEHCEACHAYHTAVVLLDNELAQLPEHSPSASLVESVLLQASHSPIDTPDRDKGHVHRNLRRNSQWASSLAAGFVFIAVLGIWDETLSFDVLPVMYSDAFSQISVGDEKEKLKHLPSTEVAPLTPEPALNLVLGVDDIVSAGDIVTSRTSGVVTSPRDSFASPDGRTGLRMDSAGGGHSNDEYLDSSRGLLKGLSQFKGKTEQAERRAGLKSPKTQDDLSEITKFKPKPMVKKPVLLGKRQMDKADLRKLKKADALARKHNKAKVVQKRRSVSMKKAELATAIEIKTKEIKLEQSRLAGRANRLARQRRAENKKSLNARLLYRKSTLLREVTKTPPPMLDEAFDSVSADQAKNIDRSQISGKGGFNFFGSDSVDATKPDAKPIPIAKSLPFASAVIKPMSVEAESELEATLSAPAELLQEEFRQPSVSKSMISADDGIAEEDKDVVRSFLPGPSVGAQ